jgi:GTP-binding protein
MLTSTKGFPNAGKSTLLAALTNATPKVAPYPFTTLSPYVGIVELPNYDRFSMADLPGLIEGAHENKGLGHKFLKHIERTKAICYIVDMLQTERDPYDDYLVLKKELSLYNPVLLERPSILVANKMDHPKATTNLKLFMNRTLTEELPPVLAISAKEKLNLDKLKSLLAVMAGAMVK